MIEDFKLEELVEPALKWYEQNKRDLPWRQDRNPYRIWVSEIMLQQTRVEAVIPYYHRFMEALPTIEALAVCPEDPLLKLWEGLGYYNRVRNMQRAAQVMVDSFGGAMPDSFEEIIALPGIGPYTAGAIASIAYDEKVAAVDGNVLRIIARVTEDDSDILKDSTKKRLTKVLNQVMPEAAGQFNQALMEIGATVCVPNGAPRCEACPWKDLCLANKNQTWDRLPVKAKAKARRIEEKTVLLIRDGEKVVLRKRPKKGLLAGLYEFPNLETYKNEQEILSYVKEQGLVPLHIKELPEAKHIFSHVEWHMRGYLVQVADVDSVNQELKGEETLLLELEEIQKNHAIPSAFEKYAALLNIQLGVEK